MLHKNAGNMADHVSQGTAPFGQNPDAAWLRNFEKGRVKRRYVT
jgi:hypothetical protein